MNSFNLVAAEMSIDFLYSDHSDVASWPACGVLVY